MGSGLVTVAASLARAQETATSDYSLEQPDTSLMLMLPDLSTVAPWGKSARRPYVDRMSSSTLFIISAAEKSAAPCRAPRKKHRDGALETLRALLE